MRRSEYLFMFYGIFMGALIASRSSFLWWETMQNVTLSLGIVWIMFYWLEELREGSE